MSENKTVQETDHAMLVVWGQYAHCLRIPQEFAQVPMSQKTVEHSPQSKVLEFLVAQLGGLAYLKDISLSATPLDQDTAVAHAWGQEGWADHSGVSRTMSVLTEEEAAKYAVILDKATQSLIDLEVQLALSSGRLVLDGDLTPRPVSNGSKSYPESSYGYMDGKLQLGYQAAVITMISPTYGRLGLSATRHTGKTVSATQAESLALDAERRLGRRPWRRTDLLLQRLEQREPELLKRQQRVAEAAASLRGKEENLAQVNEKFSAMQDELQQLEAGYAAQERLEKPHSRLAQVRSKADVWQKRCWRCQNQVTKAQAWLDRQRQRLSEWEAETAMLRERLQRFEAENAVNSNPIEAIFRLDAGFGTDSNLALLIEMGYEIYSKPYGNWLSGLLAEKSQSRPNDWQKVGKNAEMLAWKAATIPDFPYPLDLGYERFWQSPSDSEQPKQAFSGLLHFGATQVTEDLTGWFDDYNSRQTIEAGNKEARQVFQAHHIKVRSLPAMRLQEHFALFCANFVRFAAHWLAEQCPQVPDGWKTSHSPNVKEQVKVGAHSPAYVQWYGKDCLVRFKERSVYVGRSFFVRRQIAIQLTLRI
jgi:uncharacterized membrane-anchored protein YhcB (DUF1043 family)